MLEMVNLEPFKGLNLTVSFTTDEMHDIARALGARYSAANCETRALDTFAGVELENASTTISICFICECELYPEQEMESESEKSFEQVVGCYHEDCEMWCHTSCLVDHFRSTKDLDSVEEQGPNLSGECPQCEQVVQWPLLTQHHGSNRDKRKRTKSGKSNQTKKKVRAVCSQTESNEDKGSEDLLEERSTNENAVRKRGNENGGDSISIDSASSYNSDGWFEDDVDDTSMDLESMETDHAWEKSAPNILDVEIPTRSANDMGTIDLTED
ncbi:unnamed protein product [Phytophthora lilii]|uniref:Unnamed protein product n=1 Tax=Phytophthora lilii TaxID=2077276 RepID=A0A9W6U3F4_9STRA|nr:unnamed protein product [Phytophthora lilii]